MRTKAITRTPPSLAVRICTVLEAVAPRALHYTVIAQCLHEPEPRRVGMACIRLAGRGRLRWVREGTYRLRDVP